MPGTVRRIIDRIKDQRSRGNSVVALTVETRLVLQGFDPQRFDESTADEPGRLARINEIADEMHVDVSDLIAEADVEPDPAAAPEPPPAAPEQGGSDSLTESAQAAARAAGVSPGASGAARAARPEVPDDHPLRGFHRIAEQALAEIAPDNDTGARTGASFALLMKSSLLMALFSIGSDHILCDQLRYNALFQWFLGVRAADADFDPDAFAADREQALSEHAAGQFFERVAREGGRERLFASEHLQADGRLIKSWISRPTRA